MKIKLAILNTHPIQYFAPLYKELAKEKNIDLTVLYCSKWGVSEYIDPQFKTSFKWDIPLLEGYNYKFLKNLRKTQDVNKFFNLLNLEIIPELIRSRYDALWINGHNNLTNIIAVTTGKILGIKLLMRADSQMIAPTNKIKKFLRKPVMKNFYRLFSGFLYIGTLNKNYYEYLQVPADKLFFVPFAIDNDYYYNKIKEARQNSAYIRNKFESEKNSLIILFVSKLISLKRPMDIVVTYQTLISKFANLKLLIVGAGEEEKRLKSYISNNNIDGVKFLGFINQSQLPEIYSIADVFVLPSNYEKWGLVINEAMCAGLPIISTDVVGAAPDLVKDGINGYTYKFSDINDLANKLNIILSDALLRKRMGEKSKEIISSWSYKECITGIQQALKSVIR